MTVILPEQTQSQIGMKNKKVSDKHPTLYLLHGFSDDHTIWTRRTSIERYVSEMGLAVVMPNVHHSFYTDMEYLCRNYDEHSASQQPDPFTQIWNMGIDIGHF